MEFQRFKDVLYAKMGSQLFVWESSWDCFRPIEKIAWNGKFIQVVDTKYKQDIFSPYYGFGSPEMKEFCKDISEPDIQNSETLKWLDTEWWRDRKCTFSSDCVPRTPASWQRYVKYTNSKPRTLRLHSENRKTKRVLREPYLSK